MAVVGDELGAEDGVGDAGVELAAGVGAHFVAVVEVGGLQGGSVGEVDEGEVGVVAGDEGAFVGEGEAAGDVGGGEGGDGREGYVVSGGGGEEGGEG